MGRRGGYGEGTAPQGGAAQGSGLSAQAGRPGSPGLPPISLFSAELGIKTSANIYLTHVNTRPGAEKAFQNLPVSIPALCLSDCIPLSKAIK